MNTAPHDAEWTAVQPPEDTRMRWWRSIARPGAAKVARPMRSEDSKKCALTSSDNFPG